ncbi:lipid A-modifier LpxR family protein [Flagellimonas sp. DF-77]|uniref:lipid A-modifier LpxR family protein n=1 Tax=Flagellimonas algarum TaxID=3230298 RepID=UPI0033990B98
MKLLAGALVSLLSITVFPQAADTSASVSQQLEIRHDNDFFAQTDRYYTSGLFLTYRKKLAKGVFGTKEQIALGLGQEVFTPSQTQSTNPALFDRPYVGFTGIHGRWNLAETSRFYELGALIGLAGVNSGAGGFQRWYHRALSIAGSPIWTAELDNRLHLNFYGRYIKEWWLHPNPFGIVLGISPKLALGTRDVFAETGVYLHLGRRNSIDESMAAKRLGGMGKELYITLQAAYRQVGYNGLIEGHLLGDDSTVIRDIENGLLIMGVDLKHRNNRHDYSLGVRYNSAETPQAKGHTYIIVAYALGW